MTPRLKMSGVQKSFGATRALQNVRLEVAPGEVHALIGENGAGKSTLMKVLSGACPPDAGRIELDGQPFAPANPAHARRGGIAMIYQELNLAPHLSVEENILLGEEPARFGWLNRRRRRELARAALAELRHDNIPLEAPVGTRPIAEQQIVEIARALVGQPKVLIMDEPTSSLTQVDTENLFAVIERLRQRGVSIIYISHFLEECQRLCQRYTVLRDGETVGAGAMAGADLSEIIQRMVGREMKEIYPRVPHALGEPVLELREFAGKLAGEFHAYEMEAAFAKRMEEMSERLQGQSVLLQGQKAGNPLLPERLQRWQSLQNALPGESDNRLGTFAHFRLQVERPAMQLDQVLHDRQPQAGAAFGILMSERTLAEHLHDLRDFVLWDARAVVAHAQDLAALGAGANAQGDRRACYSQRPARRTR